MSLFNNIKEEDNNMENLVYVDNNQLVVSSRSIAEHFEKAHKHILESIEKLKAENSALTSMFYETTYKAGTGKSYKEYLLNRDGFSLLVMGFTGKKALDWKLKYIEAFNKMENQLKPALPDFTNPVEAARAWANEYEAKQKVLAQIEEQKPKVLFANAVDAGQNSILIGDLAKLLKQNGIETGQKRLFAWLRDNNYLMKSGSSKNLPTQKAMEMGLFEVKEGTYINKNDVSITTRTTKVTGKGQIFFINKFLSK